MNIDKVFEECVAKAMDCANKVVVSYADQGKILAELATAIAIYKSRDTSEYYER
jgi:hypothetical protein